MKFIAEFCQNHNGDYNLLQEMCHSAAEAGATYGKIQSIFAKDLTNRSRFEINGKEDGSLYRPYQSEYERLKRLELSWDLQEQFLGECRKYGLQPMTTVFTREDVKRLLSMNWAAIKVASYDCGSLPMIMDLSEGSKKLYISTGSSFDDEVSATASYLSEKKIPFALLHCVTIYPTPLEKINLRRMEWLRMMVSEVGFSDHSLVSESGVLASMAAVYLGADVIERHYTNLSSVETKDGPVSITASELRELIQFSQLSKAEQQDYLLSIDSGWERMLGEMTNKMTKVELANRDYYRGRFASRNNEGNFIFNWENR